VTPSEETRRHIELLRAGLAEKLVTPLWSSKGNTSRYPRSAVGAVAGVGALQGDIYVSVSVATADVAQKRGRTKRINEDSAAGLVGFAIDFDVIGTPDGQGGAKKTGAPSVEAAIAASHLLAEPTLIIASGGGVQPWWLFDEPLIFSSTDERKQVKAVCAQWQEAHRQASGFEIDSTFDLARVMRVAGTRNYKSGGEGVAVWILEDGGPRRAYAKLTELVADIAVMAPSNGKPAEFNGKVPPERVEELVADLCARYPGFIETWKREPDRFDGDDSRYDLSIATKAVRHGLTDDEAHAVGRANRLMHDPNDEKAERADYFALTIAKARARSDDDGEHVPTSDLSESGSTRASTIKPRRIRWVWRGRLARGYLSIQSGESSIGKSTQACSTIADLTHGRLEGHLEGEPTRVLIVASEDAREDIWVPRLIVAGADLERVEFQDQSRDWNLRDGMGLTAQVLDQVDAKLVFVDSVLEHMPEAKGGENINSPTFIRRSLGAFADLCKTRHVAGLVSTHPPKSKGSTFADSVIASAAFVHMTRVGLLFAWHPEDLELSDQGRRRVLMRPPGGSNIGRDPGTFEFRVLTKELLIEGEMEEVPYTTPLEPSDVTFRDLTRTPKDDHPARLQVVEARALIDERLADGEWHPSMIDELIEQGFKRTTSYEAADPYVKVKSSFSGGWWWAAAGTSKDTFVEVDRNTGPCRAHARRNSDESDIGPKHPNNPINTPRSEDPVERDETEATPSVAAQGPIPDLASRARAVVDEEPPARSQRPLAPRAGAQARGADPQQRLPQSNGVADAAGDGSLVAWAAREYEERS
jgi:AAA domain